MAKYRFVHLSDIHFMQLKDGRQRHHDDIRDELLRDCRRQHESRGKADGILVTGDTAFSGRSEEYKRAGDWLDGLTDAVGCSPVSVKVIPGNHDVDLDRVTCMGHLAHKQLREGPIDELDTSLIEILRESEASNPLLMKFGSYLEFASRYGCNFRSPQLPFWSEDYPLTTDHRLRVVGLNSVLVSDRIDSVGKMVLGKNQYVLRNENNIEYIVMVHHPLDWFRDGHEARTYLHRARIVMTGHEHNLTIQKQSDERGNERLEIGAGATNPPEGTGIYYYRYNWLEFETQPGDKGMNLVVTVYPRVWEPTYTEFVADMNRLQGQRCVSFSLTCPNFNSETRVAPVMSTTVVEPKDEVLMTNPVQQTNKSEADDFARLRYYFWRYLTWQKRLQVLVELNILPSTADQPLPQTMERLALDTARRQLKLPELWNAVMQSVPEDKRQANPF